MAIIDMDSIKVYAMNDIFFECPMFGKEIPLSHTIDNNKNVIVEIPHYLINAISEVIVQYYTTETV